MNALLGSLIYALFHAWFPTCTVEVYWITDDVLVQESPDTCPVGHGPQGPPGGQVYVQDVRGMVRTCYCGR